MPTGSRRSHERVRLIDGGHPGFIGGLTIGVVMASESSIRRLDDEGLGVWVDLQGSVRVELSLQKAPNCV